MVLIYITGGIRFQSLEGEKLGSFYTLHINLEEYPSSWQLGAFAGYLVAEKAGFIFITDMVKAPVAKIQGFSNLLKY